MVTLAEVKAFIRVDFPDDDASITNLIDAASNHLTSIGVDMAADPMPQAVEHAQMILIAYWYDNSGSDTPRSVNGMEMSIDRLLAPYMEISL